MKINEYFSNSMNDIDSMYMGMYFLELADYYGREGIEAKDTLELLYIAMKQLGKKAIPIDLIRCIYELRTLVIQMFLIVENAVTQKILITLIWNTIR